MVENACVARAIEDIGNTISIINPERMLSDRLPAGLSGHR
jgi:hypothetical protein